MAKFTETPQWTSGQSVADFLDAFFRQRGWTIEPTTRHEERDLCLGDRHFRKLNRHDLIEYKSGLQTKVTGNVFLETISVDTKGIPGWVHTCQADYIFYAALLNRKILVFIPDDLRSALASLRTQFREVKTSKGQNEQYNTHGLIVPLAYAEEYLSAQTIETDEPV